MKFFIVLQRPDNITFITEVEAPRTYEARDYINVFFPDTTVKGIFEDRPQALLKLAELHPASYLVCVGNPATGEITAKTYANNRNVFAINVMRTAGQQVLKYRLVEVEDEQR